MKTVDTPYVNTPGRYHLAPLERSTGVRMLRLPDGRGDGRVFDLSFRQPLGVFDSAYLDPNAGNGDQGVILAGRPAGGKTGTWQYRDSATQNAHAWFVGFTPGQLAAAVWVGNSGTEQPIKMKDGRRIYGATLPGPIWKKFMTAALKGEKKVPMPEKIGVGDTTLGDAAAPPVDDRQPQRSNGDDRVHEDAPREAASVVDPPTADAAENPTSPAISAHLRPNRSPTLPPTNNKLPNANA